ncbi:transporter, partial [bacterium]|nr:transporter [bacterium]
AIDLGKLQVVPGIAFPIGFGPSKGEYGAFAYLSFEHPLF